MESSQRKERTKTIYNELAPYYDRLRLICRRKDIPYGLGLLDLEESDTILDAGMGPGIHTFALLRERTIEKVVGIDLSEEFVSMAREKAAREDFRNCEFRIADLEQLPFDDYSFDKIICSGVLLLIPDQEQALRELYRVLKPGGKIVFVEPLNEIFLAKECFYVFAKFFLKVLAIRNKQLRGLSRSDFAGRYFSQEDLSELLNSVGFSDVKVIRNRVEVYGVCLK